MVENTHSDKFAALRQRAEEVLQRQPEELREMPPEDIQHLIHELQVHQIELEMQNEELHRTQRELEASRDRYSDLYDFAPVGYFTLSEKGLILEANLTSATMLRAERGRLIKRPLTRFIASEDQDIYYFHRKQLFETQAPQVCELRMVRKDGSQFWARMEAIVAQARTETLDSARDKLGRSARTERSRSARTERSRSDSESDTPVCRVTVSDITERKELEAQLRHVQKMESIGRLAAGIAHDFNNLLTPIGGFAELLLGKAPEGSKQHEYLRQIKVAARRAADLTGQLRLFTRQMRGERRSVQLNSLVEETCDLLAHSISKKIAIELRLEPELWVVEADPSQLSQVLMNLGVNARDAMLEGGTLTLETRNVTLDEDYARMVLEAQPGRYVRLSVSDTGCGMSPEVQAWLFEPFFTTKEMAEGTGLGLATVYGIVKGHDGFIQVYSEEGRGSTFHVYLPAMEGALEERKVEEWDLPTGTETILVVDDEEGVLALGQAVLEPCGYTVLMAEDGVQALEVYQTHREEIALVVLDVIMPQMSGLECLRRLREMDPQVKVLISTGYTARDLAQELVAEGALGVAGKPFQVQDFATAVRGAIDE
jgi:two-component system cell cycle sensor histidine kinase/response regulator CckA